MTPADSANDYAYWTAPGERLTVTYSLPVFHDIDFQASEGFRRIPHGGIETGGLLFGRFTQEGSHIAARIEAFRPIECEHASGPSFALSERDIAALRVQLTAKSDPELQGLEVVGWFVAHTRSPLEMNEREAALFAQLFPGPGRMLMLVKPERFQATRFAFVFRGADGRLDRDAAANAIILPLPGRGGRAAQGPAVSIPAPAQSAPRPAAPAKETPAAAVRPTAPAPPALDDFSAPDLSTPSETSTTTRAFWRNVPLPGVRREPVVKIQEPSPVLPPEEVPESTALTAEPARERQQPITRSMRREGAPSALRIAALLVLAAGLGCGVGYFAYLQLPPATIALRVQREPATEASATKPGLIVSWPAEETRGAIFASIRVDDGEAVPLSTQQKDTGRALVPVRSDNVKIELIAQRRWRDSRGIVRYVRAANVTP